MGPINSDREFKISLLDPIPITTAGYEELKSVEIVNYREMKTRKSKLKNMNKVEFKLGSYKFKSKRK